jgi:histone H3/H4
MTFLFAGIIRISREFYDEASEALKAYLRRCMSKIVPLTEYAKRTTVISNDVAYALKQMGT